MGEMEYVDCTLCDGKRFSPRLDVTNAGTQFHWVICDDCGLVLLNPRPSRETMQSYYTDQYSAYSTSMDSVARAKRALIDAVTEDFRTSREGLASWSWPRRILTSLRRMVLRPIRHRFIRLPPKPDGGRLLDIGCSVGFELDLAHRVGWETYGVEIGAKPVQICRQKGHSVFDGELREADFPDAFFHAVSLWNVLEHLHQPVDTLKEIHRILLPGGSLLLRVPDVGSRQARLFGDNWYPAQHVPHHLHLFSSETLRRLLERTGFEVVYRARVSSPRSTVRYCNSIWDGKTPTAFASIPTLQRSLGAVTGVLLYIALELVGGGEQLIICATSLGSADTKASSQ